MEEVRYATVLCEGAHAAWLSADGRAGRPQMIRCIDERASKVQRWTPEDGRPDKVGQYYAVDHLHVEKTKVGSARVFRPESWEIAMIVSEEIKEALERIGARGVKFQEV